MFFKNQLWKQWSGASLKTSSENPQLRGQKQASPSLFDRLLPVTAGWSRQWSSALPWEDSNGPSVARALFREGGGGSPINYRLWHRFRCCHACDLIGLEETYIWKEDLSRMIELYRSWKQNRCISRSDGVTENQLHISWENLHLFNKDNMLYCTDILL